MQHKMIGIVGGVGSYAGIDLIKQCAMILSSAFVRVLKK